MKEPRPSSTAWIVAAATAFVALDPALGKLVPPAAVQPTLACLRAKGSGGGLKRIAVRWFGRGWFRRRVERHEAARLPGFMLHVAARKRAIEEATRRAMHEGFKQVVVLGAGYDTLALRLHQEFPKLHCVEIDQAATQRVKLSCAMQREIPSPTLGLVAADLSRQELPEVLGSCPVFKPGLDTVYIAEGLFMYLSEETVRGVLASIRAHEGKRCRVVFTFIEPGPGGRANFPGMTAAMHAWLERQGEPLRWGLKREQAAGWLAERGYNVVDVAGQQTFRQRYLSPTVPEERKVAAGEFVCVAERRG